MPFVPSLYLITDRKQTAGRSLCDIIREAGEAGVPAVQFREKDLALREQLELATKIQKITQSYGMKLLINDRVDLCLALDADGVHLPGNGLPLAVVRRLLGEKKIMGLSCHSHEDVLRAQTEGADFALLGPVYDTPLKRPYGLPLGPAYFQKVRHSVSLPLVAIGGIHAANLAEVLSTGAAGVALMSAILQAPDVKAECKHFLQQLRGHCGR